MKSSAKWSLFLLIIIFMGASYPEEVKNRSFYISRVEILNERGEHTTSFKYGEKMKLLVIPSGRPKLDYYNLIFHIYNELGYFVCAGAAAEYHGQFFNQKVKRIGIEIGPLILTKGRYRIKFIVREGRGIIDTGSAIVADVWDNAISFTIIECQPFETSWEMPIHRDGICVINHSFSESG